MVSPLPHTPLHNTIEMAMKLRLSREATEQLAARAAKFGRPLDEYASQLLEEAIIKPSIDDLLAPLRAEVAASGMSDTELDAFHEQLRDKVWSAKQAKAL